MEVKGTGRIPLSCALHLDFGPCGSLSALCWCFLVGLTQVSTEQHLGAGGRVCVGAGYTGFSAGGAGGTVGRHRTPGEQG